MNTNQTFPITPNGVYSRVPKKGEFTGPKKFWEKKIADRVYLVKYAGIPEEMLVHHCEGKEHYKEMTFRENDEGPMYWCEGCGYVVDNGTAMAIRLYEAPIA